MSVDLLDFETIASDTPGSEHCQNTNPDENNYLFNRQYLEVNCGYTNNHTINSVVAQSDQSTDDDTHNIALSTSNDITEAETTQINQQSNNRHYHCMTSLYMANHSETIPTYSNAETFFGYIHSTEDALLLFEACRKNELKLTARRLNSKERREIRSGSVFVFDEHNSGIRRWTDGLLWSPSRILGKSCRSHNVQISTV